MNPIQPYSSFQALGVPPQQPSDLKLSGPPHGAKAPYIFSLGVNSTIPYIQLLGSSHGQKLFTWNEQIIVPPGQMVTVKNASYHPGDIFMQSGADPSAKAGRVTIPVRILLNEAGTRLIPEFNVDVRRARRAFVTGFRETPNVVTDQTMTVVGTGRQRSYPSNPAFATEGNGAAPRYTSVTNIPPQTEPGLVPLGDDASPFDTVHSLLDVATFSYTDIESRSSSGAFHYVLEYL